MLSHQLPVLPTLSDFWDALPKIFSWITSRAPVPERALIQHGAGEIAIRSRVLRMGVPLPSRSTLEIIRFAEHRSYRVDRMQRAIVTSQVFSPRYGVELTSTGPLTVPPS
jgi:hypothetical protein